MAKESDIKKNQSFFRTFDHAIEGCIYAFTTQRNFLVHFFLSFLAIVLSIWLEISFGSFLLIIFAIVFGLAIEMANTAFEKTVDLITEEYNPKAKIVKDVAAGMMLIASIGLAVIGMLILAPPLFGKILNII